MAKKILVVDDDRDLLRALGLRLKANGYDVVQATDAAFALREARSEKPDLVILDLGLPGGEGFWVMERMRSFPALCSVPIVVLTGRDPEANREGATLAGASAYFQKPADPERLLATVAELLEGGDGAPASASGSESQSSRGKILLVDDDRDLLRAIGVRLKANGYSVDFATDSPSAITATREGKPDAVILDIGLPGGGGFWVLERLSDLSNAGPPVIVVTCQDPQTNEARARQAGALAFLQKPVDPGELLAALQEILAQPST